ncbi:unnamed protein product [Symbiodinium sp. KB8]|nr:unnamed protein product [Symbiodinium sp. KB8]
MDQMSVSGIVRFDSNAAYLRLEPVRPTETRAPSASNARNVPWPASTTRPDDQIFQAVLAGEVKVHATRQPMNMQTLKVSMNNIQGSLKLKIGTGAGNDDVLAIENTKSEASSVDQPMSENVNNKNEPIVDEAPNVSDGKWVVNMPAKPYTQHNNAEGHVTIPEYLESVCRPLDKSIKSVAVLFDAHIGIPECGRASSIGQLITAGQLSELPLPLRFRTMPPDTAKVDIIIENTGDGCINALKLVYFEKPVPSSVAVSISSGSGFVLVQRPGPWVVRKGLQWTLDRVSGFQLRCHTLETKGGNGFQRASSATWSPETDELSEGIRFINNFAPECDAMNEQTFWVLTNIRPDSNSPIAGWPEAKVRMMAQNKARGASGATSLSEFPLQTFSLNSSLATNILPLLYPMLTSKAILLLGCPGVGKTPAVIAMAMAIGRHHIRRLQLHGVRPGWRRSKSFDSFRQRCPQVQEAIFLDDPSMGKVDIADLKSFVTVDGDGTVDGRYNDAKLVRNQMRAFASNDTGSDPKVIPSDTMLDSDEFLKLLEPLFDGAHLKHVLAVLKRSAVLVFTETALYLRFPNEKVDGKVHRIVRDDLHKDLLGARDKPVYGAYKQQGIITYPPHFETEGNQEQDMIDAGVERMNKFSNFQEYVDYCDSEIQKWLRPVRHLPPSPSQDSQEASDDTNAQRAALGLPPVFPPIGTGPKPNRLRGGFVYPSSTDATTSSSETPASKMRRLRAKTPSVPVIDAAADTNPGMDADEEAAAHMHD